MSSLGVDNAGGKAEHDIISLMSLAANGRSIKASSVSSDYKLLPIWIWSFGSISQVLEVWCKALL